jgi:hypothetical protein
MRAGVNVRFLVAANDHLLSERAGISGRSAPIRWIDVPTSLPRALHRAAHREGKDWGAAVAAASGSVVRPQRPTSILLSDELKEALRRRGRELGVGYQTAAKFILAKYVNAKL